MRDPPTTPSARPTSTASARAALGLVRHGAGRSLVVEERYPPEAQLVACPAPLLVQALLQLLVAARPGEAGLTLEVSRGTIEVSPGAGTSVATLVAARIAADHGGSLDVGEAALTLHLPPA